MADYSAVMRVRMNRMEQLVKSGMTPTEAGVHMRITKGQAMRAWQNLKTEGRAQRLILDAKGKVAQAVSEGHELNQVAVILGMPWGRVSALWQDILRDMGPQAV